MMNHEDTLEVILINKEMKGNYIQLYENNCYCQDSEELSDEEEEMKIAEMRPPLIEISINQPKVVTLNKDKKGKNLHV